MYAMELFRMTFPLAAQRIKRTPFRRRLDAMTSRGEVEAFLATHPQPRFQFYAHLTQTKREEFIAVVRHLGLDLAGKVHLDIGPAYGESLEIAMERGARRADFIELDDCFYTWNRVKNVGEGLRGNYLLATRRLKSRAYDTVYIRGLPQVETMWPLRQSWLGFLRLDTWLDQVDRVVAPGGTVILSPNWRSSGDKRTATPDWRAHPFCALMAARGYHTLPWVEGHNREPEYPVTFVRVAPTS